MVKLEFTAVICKLGKISNNLLKVGAHQVTEFTIPVEGIMLNQYQLETALEDTLVWRSWFNQIPSKPAEPCSWWSHSSGEFAISDQYEAEELMIEVSGDRVLEFLADLPEEGKERSPACRITKIKLQPMMGGLTAVSFSLHVRPGLARENLILQEHQNMSVKLSLYKSAVSKPSEKQAELPLCPRPVGGLQNETLADGDRSVQTNPHTDTTARKSAVEGPTSENPGEGPQASKVGHSSAAPGPEDSMGPDAPPEQYSERLTTTDSDGKKHEWKSGAEVDADIAKRKARKLASLLADHRNDDLEKFEKGLSANIQAHAELDETVIDGRIRK